MRLNNEIVKRDALIDMLAKELDGKKPSESKPVYIVNGMNDDMLELV